MPNSFDARSTFQVDGRTFHYYRLDALSRAGLDVSRLPFSLKILLENLLRHEDGITVTADDIKALASWDPKAEPDTEIAFRPSRVLLQDFTGVPAIVDLAAMRDAMKRLGGDPRKINPLQPVELVIDHSVQVDEAGTPQAFADQRRAGIRAQPRALRLPPLGPERASTTSASSRRTPASSTRSTSNTWPAWSSTPSDGRGRPLAYPDTLVGTDSHTTMINGLGVLGWGVGGIEAEAAMLGQPVSMLVPAGRRLQAHRHPPRRGDRHRPGADRHPDAAEEGRGRQVRRVLRRRPGRASAGRPGHDRQHGPRVRRDLRDVPDRRRDAPIPRALGPAARARSAWSRRTAKAQGMFHAPGAAEADVFRHARARPLDGRAEPGRPAAAAGPRAAARRQGVVRRRRSRSCQAARPAKTKAAATSLPVVERSQARAAARPSASTSPRARRQPRSAARSRTARS